MGNLDISHFLQDSTSGFGARMYSANVWGPEGLGGFTTQLLDTLYASVFYIANETIIDKLFITHVSGSANTRCGIYLADNPGNTTHGIYPTSLVVDSGEVNIPNTRGTYAFPLTPNVTIPANTLIWLATVCDTTQVNTLVNLFECTYNIFGDQLNGVHSPTGLLKAFTYAALPDPFPSGATYDQPITEVLFSPKTITIP